MKKSDIFWLILVISLCFYCIGAYSMMIIIISAIIGLYLSCCIITLIDLFIYQNLAQESSANFQKYNIFYYILYFIYIILRGIILIAELINKFIDKNNNVKIK